MAKKRHKIQSDKELYETRRRQTALANTKFNRYMLIRYSLAILFFGNAYWAMMHLYGLSFYALVPVLLMSIAAYAGFEQIKMYGTDKIHLKGTQFFFRMQLCVHLLSLFLIFVPQQFSTMYPILADTPVGHLFVLLMTIIGIFFSWLALRRIEQIMQNKDKAYKRIQALEKFI